MPAELGPWSWAAQTFVRWSRLGAWERLLGLAQEKGVELGMTLLDGTNIRARQKAAGARRKGAFKLSESQVRRLGNLVVGYGTEACVIADALGRAVAFIVAPGQAHELPHPIPLLDRLPSESRLLRAWRIH